MLPPKIEFHRLTDGIVYHFSLGLTADGRPMYERNDGIVQLLKDEDHGWVVMHVAEQVIVSRPWTTIADMIGDLPPRSAWVSYKSFQSSKSYVYELRYVE